MGKLYRKYGRHVALWVESDLYVVVSDPATVEVSQKMFLFPLLGEGTGFKKYFMCLPVNVKSQSSQIIATIPRMGVKKFKFANAFNGQGH